jgi:hypothetical protein
MGLRQTQERRWHADIFGFLWYDPSVAPQPLTDWPRAKLFRDIDWAMLRSAWDDPKGLLLGLKGGQKDWDHAHHDTNSIVLYAHGRPLIIDLLYPHDIWGCRTEAHNTIMVDGKDQRGEVRVAGMRGQPDQRGVIGDLLDAGWYARLVGDASLAYEQGDVRSFVREIMYLRHVRGADPPDYFVLFDDVSATHPARLDWLLHTYGDLDASGDRITITQDDAAVDVTMVAPPRLEYEIASKALEEARSPKPFDGAERVRYVKARPPEPVQREQFLAVLAPRRASDAPTVAVQRIETAGLLGAVVSSGSVRDCALFALDAPDIRADGIEAIGRSCLVRRTDGRVTAAALQGGQRLSADGALLFETDGCGHVALAFTDEAVDATLDLYDAHWVRLRCAKAPQQVFVNGHERKFDYEADRNSMRLDGYDIREVRVLFE